MGKKRSKDELALALEAYRLHLYGWSVYEISVRLNRKPAWVARAIRRAEAALAKYHRAEIEQVRDRLIARLEDVVSQAFPRLQEGELRAADVIVRATQLQARMLGIEEGNRAAQETAVKLMRELAARLGLFHAELEVVPEERPGLPEPAKEQEPDAAIEEVEPDQ